MHTVCMKDQVYSWRISTQKQAELESEAHREGSSLASLLEQITADWLHERLHSRNGDQAEPATLKRRVMATVGTQFGAETRRARCMATTGSRSNTAVAR